MRDVCVLGIGQGVFGKFPQGSVATLGCGAARAALEDAGIEALQLQAIYANQQFSRMIAGQTTVPGVGIGGIEMAKGDDTGAGGAAAVWRLWKDVATGIVDVGIAVGADSVTMSPVAGKPIPQFEYEAEGILGVAIPSVFALATRRLMETQGATIQDFAQVSVKAHDAGALNPAAQSCQRTTIEQVVNSRMIADPITMLQCCPGTDGAAAIILCSGSFARRYTTRLIHIVASVVLAGDGLVEGSLTSIGIGYQAARHAYELAGVGPYDLDVVEVHDGFACEEILHYEDLELCPRGEGIALLRSGATSLGGRIPVNPSGGLLALGHSPNASGVRNICEVALHLRDEAGERQTPNAMVGLAQMFGGSAAGLKAGTAAIHILSV
jgi:benzoylsuccinyl-CoA thiolase BbsB subunit